MASPQHHRFVTGDCRLRREHVHALGPGDARHQLHREGQHAFVRQGLDRLGMRQRFGMAHNHLPGAHQLQIRPPRLRIRPQRANLAHDVSDGEDLSPGIDDSRPFGLILIVGESRLRPSALLDENLQLGFHQWRQSRRRQRYPPLACIRLLDYTDDHGTLTCCWSDKCARSRRPKTASAREPGRID